MEHHFPTFTYLLSSFMIFIFFFFKVMIKIKAKKQRSKTKNPYLKSPPGPRKLPFIGNLHQILGLPHSSLRDLANKYGPLMHLKLGEVSVIVVSSPKIAKMIMNTNDLHFADRGEVLAAKILTYNYTDVGFCPYGDYWRQMKKIFILELLSTKRVQFFKSIREEEVLNLIRNISVMANGSLINLTEMVYSSTGDITCRAAFGNKCEDKDEFLSLMIDATQMAGGFTIGDLFPSYKFLHLISGVTRKLEKIYKKVDRILDNIVKDHYQRENKTAMVSEDLLSVLLRIQESNELDVPITINNVKAVILDVFNAGTESSSTTVEWAMTELMKNPRVMKKAQAEIRHVLNRKEKIDESELHGLNYFKLVIKETLRLHPPVPLLLPRQCRENCEIDGYPIPLKTKVIINAWAIGRDPKYWSNAESFEPERFENSSIDYKGTNFEYIPFGAGRRMCPGISFGIANLELQLAQLLYHFDWKLPSETTPNDIDMSESFGMALRRKNNLYLIPIPYSPPTNIR